MTITFKLHFGHAFALYKHWVSWYGILKLSFRDQLIHFINKYFKELAYIYYDKCF